jgi:hypothetical protein
MQFDPATGGYTTFVNTVDPRINQLVDPHVRSPRTDEYSIGVDRELGNRLLASVAYIHKSGTDYIGWTDVGGQYRDGTYTLPDVPGFPTLSGRVIPTHILVNAGSDRRFLITNPPGYNITYNGLVIAAEKRPFKGWQVFGSYTYSKVYGLQADSGVTAGAAQLSTIGNGTPIVFGQDPNDLTNARGRMPNDRPNIFRIMGKADIPRTGLAFSSNFQYYTGKPWAATALVPSTALAVAQLDRRILIEPRGTRRLSSQSLLDMRLSKTILTRESARVELLVDVLNVLNDKAEEEIPVDNFAASTFGRPSVYMDPRRAMFGVKVNLGR